MPAREGRGAAAIKWQESEPDLRPSHRGQGNASATCEPLGVVFWAVSTVDWPPGWQTLAQCLHLLDDYDTWDEQMEPVRPEPDPARLNDFLAQQVSLEFREQVMKWTK